MTNSICVVTISHESARAISAQRRQMEHAQHLREVARAWVEGAVLGVEVAMKQQRKEQAAPSPDTKPYGPNRPTNGERHPPA